MAFSKLYMILSYNILNKGGINLRIEIDLSDEFLEKDRLKEFFNVSDDEDLKDPISKIIKSSLTEYQDMCVGRGFLSRAEDIRQYRLFYLIKYYYGTIPTETEVSLMFQETQSRSKTLIRMVLTRFRYDLKEQIENKLKDTFCAAKKVENEDEYRVTIQSDILVEELNRIINKEAPRCQIVRKFSGTGRSYRIQADSYDKLKVYFFRDGDCPSREEDEDTTDDEDIHG